MAQRFKIGSKVYDFDAFAKVSLKDVLLFNRQAEQMGLPERWADIERYATEMAELDAEGVGSHPGALLTTAVSIWIARRKAGEEASFEDAIDFPLSELTFLPDTADRVEKAPKAKKSTRKDSALAIADDSAASAVS